MPSILAAVAPVLYRPVLLPRGRKGLHRSGIFRRTQPQVWRSRSVRPSVRARARIGSPRPEDPRDRKPRASTPGAQCAIYEPLIREARIAGRLLRGSLGAHNSSVAYWKKAMLNPHSAPHRLSVMIVCRKWRLAPSILNRSRMAPRSNACTGSARGSIPAPSQPVIPRLELKPISNQQGGGWEPPWEETRLIRAKISRLGGRWQVTRSQLFYPSSAPIRQVKPE